jgi:hypothetical protein
VSLDSNYRADILSVKSITFRVQRCIYVIVRTSYFEPNIVPCLKRNSDHHANRTYSEVVYQNSGERMSEEWLEESRRSSPEDLYWLSQERTYPAELSIGVESVHGGEMKTYRTRA